MRVDQDEDGNLIFNRKIINGMPTMKNYGLHVAKKIIKSPEFAAKLGRTTKAKRSRYNKTVQINECQLCGFQPENSRMTPLETHHISFQCNATKNGFHEHVHKNKPSNLVILCRQCHIGVHNARITINGYQQHEDGRKLSYSS